jgi:GNAT superfamily N-acetyltransferase
MALASFFAGVSMHDIRIAAVDADIASTYAVMRQLRPHVSENDYVPLVKKLQQGGFVLAFLQEGGVVRAAAGFRMTDSLAWGHHVYVHDLVSDETTRSAGHGKALLDWVERYAKEHGCTQLHLDSGVQRHGAHRFYLRERMDITCYHFQRNIP